MIRYSRQLSSVRKTAGLPSVHTDLCLAASIRSGRTCWKWRSPQPVGFKHELIASSVAQAWFSRLPCRYHRDLLIESGSVSAAIERSGVRRQWRSNYVLVVFAGAIVWLRPEPPEDAVVRWCGDTEFAAVPAETPVVLGPSGFLGLILFALDAARDCANGEPAQVDPALFVSETMASPYPPRHHAILGGRKSAQDQRLIAHGTVLANDSDEPDPLSALFSRPEGLLEPLVQVGGSSGCNLSVQLKRQASGIARALVIDSMTARDRTAGTAEWDASYTLWDSTHGSLHGVETLRLSFSPWTLLTRLTGALGRPCPAIALDAVTGEYYGTAPAMLTVLCAGDLRDGGLR